MKKNDESLIDPALRVVNKVVNMDLEIMKGGGGEFGEKMDVVFIKSFQRRTRYFFGGKEAVHLKVLRYLSVKEKSVLFHVYCEGEKHYFKDLFTVYINSFDFF